MCHVCRQNQQAIQLAFSSIVIDNSCGSWSTSPFNWIFEDPLPHKICLLELYIGRLMLLLTKKKINADIVNFEHIWGICFIFWSVPHIIWHFSDVLLSFKLITLNKFCWYIFDMNHWYKVGRKVKHSHLMHVSINHWHNPERLRQKHYLAWLASMFLFLSLNLTPKALSSTQLNRPAQN